MAAIVSIGTLTYPTANLISHAEVLTVDETTIAIHDVPESRPTSNSIVFPRNSAGNYTGDTYKVPVYMYAAIQPTDEGNTPSMANGALAREASITVVEDTLYLNLAFNAISFTDDAAGHLQKLWYYDNTGKLNETTNSKLGYIYDQSDLSNSYSYIEETSIPLDSVANDDAGTFPSDIRCRVKVDAMGDTEQECYLVIDWNNLKCNYWSNVEEAIERAKAISNDDSKFTVESFNNLQSVIAIVEAESQKYSANTAIYDLKKLDLAVASLVVADDVLNNGEYKVSVNYYYVNNSELLFSNGSVAGSQEEISDSTVSILEAAFGNEAHITAVNGEYTLTLNAIESVDSLDSYIVNITGYGFAPSAIAMGDFAIDRETAKSIDYFGETVRVIDNGSMIIGKLNNKFTADNVIVNLITYEKNNQSDITSETIAISVNWDDIEWVSELVVNKEELQEQIGAVQNLFNIGFFNEYSEDSVNFVKMALDYAISVNDNADSSQEDVDDAVSTLGTALNSLQKPNESDKTELNEQVEAVTGMFASGFFDNFTDESVSAVREAFEAAELVNDNPTATQDEIDSAVATLGLALNGLEAAPQTTTTIETTTTTSSTTTTTTTETTTTTTSTTTTEATTTTTSTTAKNVASDDDLCKWAINDYKDKTGVTPANAAITDTSDGKYTITLTDDAGNVLDTHVIDPETGVGTNAANEEVNLPQTGNNSLSSMTLALAAFAMTGIGMAAVVGSGVLKKKEENE